MRTQRRPIHSRTRRQNHIADKLRTTRPIRARNHNRLRHTRVPNQRGLDLPRLNAETANLNLMVRTPHKLQNPIPAPARQAPAPNIPPTNPSTRNVKLPNNPNRYRLQTVIQHIGSVVGQRTTDRDARTGLLTFDSKSNGIDRSFGRTVKIGDMRNLEMARNLLLEHCREDLTSQHQMAQAGVVRSTMNDRFQIGRYATHKSYVVPHQLMPELSRRFPYHITDDDCCPAPDERQQRLLDRGIKSTRNDKRRSEATPHIQVSS